MWFCASDFAFVAVSAGAGGGGGLLGVQELGKGGDPAQRGQVRPGQLPAADQGSSGVVDGVVHGRVVNDLVVQQLSVAAGDDAVLVAAKLPATGCSDGV